jgi:serine protease Do
MSKEEKTMYENNFYSNDQIVTEKTDTNKQQSNYDEGTGKYQTYQAGGVGDFREHHRDKISSAKSAGKNKKKHPIFRKAMMSASLGILFGVFGGAGIFTVWQVGEALTGSENSGKPATQNVSQSAVVDTSAGAGSNTSSVQLADTQPIQVVTGDISEVTKEVMPAMVALDVSATVTQTDFFGQTRSYESAGGGSGFIVGENDTELLIATNNHVVADTSKIEVVFIDETKAEAQVKGTNPGMDIAVIAVPLDALSQSTKDSIKIAKLGDSDTLALGEPVIAIGNALGYGQSVTNGIVSALNREITLEDGSTGTFIQTNAAINPGNSGGALLNIKGEVIGINSNKLGGTVVEGMGFAIPISAAKPIMSELFTKEIKSKVEESGYLGISNPQAITDEIMAVYSIPKGLYITQVSDGSPAAQGGLLTGDIITDFDGETIATYEDLVSALSYYGPGDAVTVTVMRQQNGSYNPVELHITLGKRPANLG